MSMLSDLPFIIERGPRRQDGILEPSIRVGMQAFIKAIVICMHVLAMLSLSLLISILNRTMERAGHVQSISLPWCPAGRLPKFWRLLHRSNQHIQKSLFILANPFDIR
jgi:hypothetical protein